MNKIVLGTSLAPFDFTKQAIAVKSWIRNGFEVISCNVKEEIEILKENFKGIEIEFIEIERSAVNMSGRPLPYIQDILDIVSQRTKNICGFINSDIIISDLPRDMYTFIEEEAQASLVFVRRNEIGCITDIYDLNWEIHFDGIDLFFIDKRIASNFFDDGFFVQSIWDRCILTKCIILGIKIKELMNPIAFHIRHALKWNFKISYFLVTEFYHKYFGASDNVYKEAIIDYYYILFNRCEQICFYKSKDFKCLFIVDFEDESTTESIKNQDYDKIEVADRLRKGREFDYIINVKKGVIYNRIFCRTVMYIMENFNCNRLSVGRFFISMIEGKPIYNELNRNMELIRQINADSFLNTEIVSKVNGGKEAVLYHPISYESIDIHNKDIVDYRKLQGTAYLMPAGIRANEWYNVIGCKINGLNILGFLDNKKGKIGTAMLGIPVYSVEQLKENSDVNIVIASKYYGREITEQLSKIISGNRLFNASQMIYADEKGGIYFFNQEKYKRKNFSGGGGLLNNNNYQRIGACA